MLDVLTASTTPLVPLPSFLLWYILHSFSDILWFTNSLLTCILAVKFFHQFIDFDYSFFHSKIFIWFFFSSFKKSFPIPYWKFRLCFNFLNVVGIVVLESITDNFSIQRLSLFLLLLLVFSLILSHVPDFPSQGFSFASAKGEGLWWWLASFELKTWDSLGDLVDAN